MAAADPRDARAVPQADLDRRIDALQRYHALATELAEAERRNPEVALCLERVQSDAYLRAAIAVIDDLLDYARELAAALDAAERELAAQRWVNGARERTIVRQLETIRDLRRRLPPHEQDPLTPKEAFIASHAIADVIGQVVPLAPRENGHRRYLAGTCPFCGQECLLVYQWHNEFMCYQCGRGGTVADFLRLWREKGSAA